VIARGLGRAVAASPPLTITPEVIGELAESMQQAFDAVLEANRAALGTNRAQALR
jgi:adenosylmethionine-8-amino-7-oxononanoate aminotransferase